MAILPKSLSVRALFLLAFLLVVATATGIGLATPPETQASATPSISGAITIDNSGQPEHTYLGVGDKIRFRVNTTGRLRQTIVTPAITSGNHFHFRYHNHPSTVGYQQVHKAELVAIAPDGGNYLLYEHTITNGVLSNSSGQLYFAHNPAPATTADLCAPDPEADEATCRPFQFSLDGNDNNTPMAGTVRIAAGGRLSDYGRAVVKLLPATLHTVDAPANGLYRPGNKIRVRMRATGRIHASEAGLENGRLEMFIGRNGAGNIGINKRDFKLDQIQNMGDHGYADYVYTVRAGEFTGLGGVRQQDQDSDGIQLGRRGQGVFTGLCPEAVGSGCHADDAVNYDDVVSGFHTLGNVKVGNHNTALAWTNTVGSLAMHQDRWFSQSIGQITGTASGYSTWYRLSRNLPIGVSMTVTDQGPTISGTPTATQAATSYTITAYDGLERRAAHTFTIAVSTIPLLVWNSTTALNLNVYRDNPTTTVAGGAAQLNLPDATGGLAPISYRLIGDPDAEQTALQVQRARNDRPEWLTRAGNGGGILSIANNTTYRNAVDADDDGRTYFLKLVAVDSDPKRSRIEIPVTVSIETRPGVKSVALIAPADARGYRIGETITATVGFDYATASGKNGNSAAVTVHADSDARPYLLLNIGDQERRAELVPGQTLQDVNQLKFAYGVNGHDRNGGAVSIAALGNPHLVREGAAKAVPTIRASVNDDITRQVIAKSPAVVDANGLIAVSTATQLNLLRHDPNGDGQVPDSAVNAYYGADGFGPASCPTTGCKGYKLTADLTLVSDFATIANWNAVLDGNGHTISGLNAKGGSGLFAHTSTGSTIRNLGLVSPQVNSNADHVGIIAGQNHGDISNVYIADGAVKGAQTVGLLVGSHNRGTISDVYATGTIRQATSQTVVGGLVGKIGSGALRNSYSRSDAAAVVGYGASQATGAYEEADKAAAQAQTPAQLKTAKSFSGWDPTVWDFGDTCQYPVLKSGGHSAATQTARGAACTAK